MELAIFPGRIIGGLSIPAIPPFFKISGISELAEISRQSTADKGLKGQVI
jgi:hypothetical protein